jgi:hypothetical protein
MDAVRGVNPIPTKVQGMAFAPEGNESITS